MIALAPVVLTGNTQVINFSAQANSGQSWAIRVSNESAYALQIQIAGDTHWLDPWTADVWTPAQKVTQITVMPTTLISISGAPAVSLLITLAEEGESFPGVYPMALTREISGSVQAVDTPEVLINTVHTPRNVTTNLTITVDPAVQGLIINTPSANSAFQSLVVNGATTNTLYYSAFAISPNNFELPVSFGINPSVDSSYILTWVYSGGTSATDTWLVGAATASRWNYSHILGPAAGGEYSIVGVDRGRGNFPAGQMLVSLTDAQSAPWQAALSFTEFETQVNAGATNTVIAAPGGAKVIYLHSIWVWILSRPANSKLVFRDSVGPTSLAHLPEITGNLGPWNFDLKGVPLTSSSSALQINNPGAGNSDFAIGTIAYTIR